nr:phospholipid phosphatase 2-like [Labrus bergylta]
MTEKGKKLILIAVDILCVFVAALPSAILTLMFSPYKEESTAMTKASATPTGETPSPMEAWLPSPSSAPLSLSLQERPTSCTQKRLHSNSQFNQYLSALYKVVGTFLFGAAVSQSLTDLAKFTIGRPRPNFLSVCNPVSCNGYMLHINCTGNPRNVTESR